MIWVLAGTKDAREIVKLLKAEGHSVVASAVTERGRRLMKKAGADELAGAMDSEEMTKFIRERDVRAVVDATHPFAVDASLNAMRACSNVKVPYLRFERESVEVEGKDVHFVESFEEAGARAAALGKVIFYAAGSKNIDVFLRACRGKRVVVRVLKDAEILKRCVQMGIKRGDIVAANPPFTKEENLVMFRECNADVLVTKESGIIGGAKEKLDAAHELGMQVVMVKRPSVEYPLIVDEYGKVVRWAGEHNLPLHL